MENFQEKSQIYHPNIPYVKEGGITTLPSFKAKLDIKNIEQED